MLKNALIAQEPEEGWSCIIFDPISRFLGAEAETDNASATQFIALLENLILVLKGRPTIILGHHMNKSGVSGTNTDQAAARGSSALTDAVRFQINLEKKLASVSGNKSTEKTYEKDKIWMRYVKTNFTAPIPDQTLKKDPYGVLTIDRDQ
jgi:RecA-family ATPase